MTAQRHPVETLLSEIVDERTKGIPSGTKPFPIGHIGMKRWSLLNADLPLPLLVANAEALSHNIRRMQQYCDERGILLAPHGKTTMAPQLFHQQLAAGAWGMTAATVEQLAIYLHYGVRRVIIANQVTGRGNLQSLAACLERFPDLDLYAFVDSEIGVDELESAVAGRCGAGKPMNVFIEYGYAGGRTGLRNPDEGIAILRRLAASSSLRLCGIAAFEGLLSTAEDRHDDAVREMLNDVSNYVDELIEQNALPEEFFVSAGGSKAFDIVADSFADRWPGRCKLILRSGCYVTHDHGIYAANSALARGNNPLVAALELWSAVQSRPEADLAYATFGRRDAPYDSGYPIAIARIARGERERRSVGPDEVVVERLNDQHARLRIDPQSDLAVGDTLIFGISHPCAAFDRWKLIMVVDDDYIVREGLLTYF